MEGPEGQPAATSATAALTRGQLEQRCLDLQVELEAVRSEARQLEARYVGALKSQVELVCEFDPDTTLTFVNDAYCRFFGKEREELIGRSFMDLLPEEARSSVREHLRGLLEEPREILYEHEVILPNGEVGWQQWIDYPIFGSDGVVTAFRSVARDVTERRRAEQALRASEEKWRSITEHSPDRIMTIDRDLNIQFINRTNEGDRREDVVGSCVLDYLPEASRADARACFDRVLETGEPGRYAGHYVDNKGATRHFDCRVGPIARDGEIVALGITSTDLTDLKRAQEERERLEAEVRYSQKLESLGVLAGGIAHDFNNLLQGILGHAELALHDVALGTRAREHLTAVVRVSQRASELCNQMLVYSGRSHAEVRPVDLAALTGDMLDLLRASISKKATLETDLPAGLPAIEADPVQLRQIVLNLVTNASEALGDGQGTIRLSIELVDGDPPQLDRRLLAEDLPEGPYVGLEVTDTGCGMEPEVLDRIFDPFFSTKFAGRGLGLAVVLGIVRGNRGALSVESAHGGGTTFRVLFPAIRGPVAPDVEPGSTSVAERSVLSGTVLVIEDEPFVRQFAGRLLEDHGLDVLSASDGAMGLEIFAEQPNRVACVLLDMTMPDLDGIEVLRRLRAIREDVPVILTSGYSQSLTAGALSPNEIAGFLEKPYRSAELVELMRSILTV